MWNGIVIPMDYEGMNGYSKAILFHIFSFLIKVVFLMNHSFGIPNVPLGLYPVLKYIELYYNDFLFIEE